MNVLTRLALSAAFLATVGLMETANGFVTLRSFADVYTGLGISLGALSDPGVQLAQLSSAFSTQRPSHEVLDLAVRAFGYPVNGGLNLALTLVGMLLVGAGVTLRCRRD